MTFVRNILQSFCVEAFCLTADDPTVMDKVRRVLAEGGCGLGLRCIAHILHKAVGHSLDTKGVKEPVVALSTAISHIKKSNILTEDLALMVRKLELKSRFHPDRPAAEKLVVGVKWQWGYSCKTIQKVVGG